MHGRLIGGAAFLAHASLAYVFERVRCEQFVAGYESAVWAAAALTFLVNACIALRSGRPPAHEAGCQERPPPPPTSAWA